MKFLILLGFFLMPMFAQTNIWHGHIGKSEIYFYLPCDVTKKIAKENSCGYGTYFYRKSLQDIKLEEALPATKKYKFNLQVKHSLEDNAEAEELFELNYKNGQLIGYWRQKGKVLAVKLKPFNSDKKDDEEERFREVRSSFLKFKRGKVQKFSRLKKELVWIEEEHTKSTMFRLGNGFSSRIRNKLNPLLDKSQEQNALFELTCTSRWAYGSGVESLVNEVTYLSKDLLGYSTFSSYFCGGAHPDFGTTHYLVDLHTGKYYTLDDIVKFQQNVPKDTDNNWEERNKYNELVARKLRELAFKAEGMELKENQKLEEDSYDPYQLSHWEYMDWSYEKDGIRFFLDFCSAARCYRGDSYLIPFKLLESYKNPDFPYAFKNAKVFVSTVKE